MAFLFGSGQNVARSEDVKTACTLMRQWRERQLDDKDIKKISDLLALMKLTLQGTQERDADIASVGALVQAIIENDLLMGVASTIHLFPFEARKDAQIVFTLAVRYRADPSNLDIPPPAVEHIVLQRPEVISQLCSCYDHKTSIVQCGNMLREAIKQEEMAVMILYDEPPGPYDPSRIDDQRPSSGQGLFWHFFQWVEAPSFEISADAFTTFREILTRHKPLVAHWLAVNFELFFNRYADTLMHSQSYVTKRQSIKLLGEILLERTNYPIMTRYVDNPEYLKMCMNLLRDDRKMVQYEGFHVFKVFVANPNKSFPVQKILINNRDKLLRFLPNFLAERTDDQQFNDEKAFLIKQIESLPPQPVEKSS